MMDLPRKARATGNRSTYQHQISFSGKYIFSEQTINPPLRHYTGNASRRRLKIWMSAK